MATSTTNTISSREFDEIFEAVKNWGRWGADDQRGTLNFITPSKRRAAAALVQEGRVVSCTVPLPSSPAIDNPRPVVHLMVRSSDATAKDSLAGGSADYFATDVHGFNRTHIDAFCHFSYKGKLYNGLDAGLITSAGAGACTIVPASEGIVSRGILLDIPRLKGVDWLELGTPITTDDLEAAERAAGLRAETGDILLVRTGYKTRRATLGPLPWQDRRKPGLHAETLRWLHRREIAVLGGDGDSDMTPSSVTGGGLTKPIHVGTLVAMGVHLLDNCEVDDLARTCAELNRWEFQLTVAPLRLEEGTGSPVNPLALF